MICVATTMKANCERKEKIKGIKVVKGEMVAKAAKKKAIVLVDRKEQDHKIHVR